MDDLSTRIKKIQKNLIETYKKYPVRSTGNNFLKKKYQNICEQYGFIFLDHGQSSIVARDKLEVYKFYKHTSTNCPHINLMQESEMNAMDKVRDIKNFVTYKHYGKGWINTDFIKGERAKLYDLQEFPKEHLQSLIKAVEYASNSSVFLDTNPTNTFYTSGFGFSLIDFSTNKWPLSGTPELIFKKQKNIATTICRMIGIKKTQQTQAVDYINDLVI